MMMTRLGTGVLLEATRTIGGLRWELTTISDLTSSPVAVIAEPKARARRTAAERQARWRENNSLRRVELYLRPETVEQFHKLERETAAFGRAEVVEARFAGTLSRELLEAKRFGMPLRGDQRGRDRYPLSLQKLSSDLGSLARDRRQVGE